MRKRLRLPLLGLLMICPLLTGCIKRSITLTSQPEGALVYLNDEEVGRTPTTVYFTFYGDYSVRLEKEGYTTLNTHRRADAPLEDTIGIDLFTELFGGDHRIHFDWDFKLQPKQPVDEKLLVDHGRQLRALLNGEEPPAPPPADDAKNNPE